LGPKLFLNMLLTLTLSVSIMVKNRVSFQNLYQTSKDDISRTGVGPWPWLWTPGSRCALMG